MKIETQGHKWHFKQAGGLMQVQLSTIDDILNIDELDPKLWTALACPVKGLEFSEETLSLLDSDKNGRVRIPEIIQGTKYIKKYFSKPEIIMEEGDSIPLDALSENLFDCGHSPLDSAKSVLEILGKKDATEIALSDLSVNEKLFSPQIINGDGVVPPECVKEEFVSGVIKDIINTTDGCDDISGVKGINKCQFETFFEQISAIKEWREKAVIDDPKIFFLKDATDSAAVSYMKLKDKINDYYLRCSLIKYDEDAKQILKNQINSMYLDENGNLFDKEHLSQLPIAICECEKPLPLDATVNPAWAEEIETFKKNVILPIFKKELTSLPETSWRKIESQFEEYINWIKAMPQNSTSKLGLDRISEIINSDAKEKIAQYLEEEEKHPPIALATIELRKMLLYRRDFVTLVRNFVSFEDFYDPEKTAVFQCGTLYIDGRSCDLCFKVLDMAKHGVLSTLSQCFLVYCDCVKSGTGEKMQIAALISNGPTDNILVGRNGIFFDKEGNDWDATIIKIIDNPVSVKQAFWSPYKRLVRVIQEKIASKANSAEKNVMDKMTKTVDDPKSAIPAKKTDIGTVAAISVAISGFATLISGILTILTGSGKFGFILGIIGIMLIVSLPSVFIAWSKLKQRNIAPILDASGWAINGNVKITPSLGATLTNLPSRPVGAYFSSIDPFAAKKTSVKKIIFYIILLLLIAAIIFIRIKFPGTLTSWWKAICTWFQKNSPKIDLTNLPSTSN